MLVEREKEKTSSKNEIQISTGKVEPVDAPLILQEDYPNIKQDIKLININHSSLNARKRLSIELLVQIQNDPNISIEEKEKINQLIEEIKDKDFIACYSDFNGANQDLIKKMEENQEAIEEPGLLHFPDTLDYDIELYKIGRKCHGLKGRHAIIKDGKLYSSDKPLKDLKEKDWEKLKEKTDFLKNATINTENKETASGGEWSSKEKEYRIRINYIPNPEKPNEESSFYLYFQEERQMKEVELALYNLSRPDKFKNDAKECLDELNKNIQKGKKCYAIMKMLSVKDKIKKRKAMFDKTENLYKKKIKAQFIKDFLQMSVDKITVSGHNSEHKYKEPNEILKDPKPDEIKDNNELIISDFMPLISKVSIDNEKMPIKKSLNDLIRKFSLLKNEIPKEIFEEQAKDGLSTNGICFSIQKGVNVRNNSGEENKFNLNNEKCSNARYILFDKNKLEIIFKNVNDENDNFDQNVFNEDNIYEISNIIKNSNNNMNGEEENNLIILGPKINNDISINYKYKNNKEKIYSDPENVNIKAKTINPINNKEINGLTLQIYQAELNINDQKIKDLIQNISESFSLEINTINFKENFLFGYTIKLPPLKKIESPIIHPKQYQQNICFIEYNHQHFIPKEYYESNPQIIIETYCIPLISFSKKEDLIPKEQLSNIAKLLSPVIIGYSKVSINDIINKKFKYEIMIEDIPFSNSYMLIDGIEEKSESIKLQNIIEGKDYSIGNDSYIITTIDKNFIQKANDNKNISMEIKDKYFKVCFNEESEFLLRPDENMNENEFYNDISKQISDEDYQKIDSNKKYSYLPYCEKYTNREKLFKSKNLSCLSEEQKEYIINNYKPDDWIYKIPTIKVKLLSKNLGIIENEKKLSQKLYCTGEELSYSIDCLNEYTEERVIPISENSYNIFDFKEVENINQNNYQWITGIKFNNSLQMNSFIKLLNIARQNINTRKRNKKEFIPFEEKKINEIENQKYEDKPNTCVIQLDNIEFIPEYKLVEENNILEAKIAIEGLKERTIMSLFKNDVYGFENSLVESKVYQDKKNKHKAVSDEKEVKIVDFYHNTIINTKKFNDGDKKIYCAEGSNVEIDLDNDQIKDNIYNLIIKIGKDEFSTPLELYQHLNNKNCEILEQPLYKDDDKDKIYACIDMSIYKNERGNDGPIKNKYREENEKYLREPLLILKDNQYIDTPSKNNRFGLYEPNVYRRKILNLIHNQEGINIDPTQLNNYEEDQLNKMYKILKKECAILPELSNFNNFNISNLRRNNGTENLDNSYRKKLGMNLLKIQRHEKFMQMYRKNRWDLYLKNLNKGKEKNPLDFFTGIPDKKYLLKRKEDGDNLINMMYLGVVPEYREQVYSLMLDLPKLYQTTREIVYRKINKDFNFPQRLYSYFADQLFEDNPKRNIIFSLIDNDSNLLCSFENTNLEEINQIKKIAKAFFIWSELRIGLDNENDKYVYFIGLLTLTQQLLQNFKKEYFTFWVLIGLAKNITHFHQKNPLFSDELNYINICGLVTKLIMETHLKKIYDKFISLNIPPELFISNHLSTLFTDYFKGELMMRILDIIVFESSLQDSYSDKLYYLRVLCSIPLTLYEFSEDQILACKSVSEIESITNDLFSHTFNRNGFIAKLKENLNKFYVVSNIFENWFFNKQGREWDSKRGDLENLIKRYFYPLYEENKQYLFEIKNILKQNSEEIINHLFNDFDSKLNSIKSLYYQGTANFDDSTSYTGINIQISSLKQIYNNLNGDNNEYSLIISFGDTANKPGENYDNSQFKINFDSQNNEILNIQDLFYKNQFQNDRSPKYIHFSLFDKHNQNCANFSFKILNYEPMKLSKITLENRENINKFYLEFILFKYNTKMIPADDLVVYSNIFGSPEYYNSKKIEEKLYSCNISNYYFKNEISKLIQQQNNDRNRLLEQKGLDQNMIDMFKKINNSETEEDKFNYERIINKRKNNIFNEKISQKILKIIEPCFQEDVSNIVKKWLRDTNISFEEILYGIILVDKSIISVNEKLFLLFSIAQMRDKLILNTDNISIEKLKEMIYSLYKRFRIFFTKSDIERMVDFLLKDERLFNIKYAFVHDKKDNEKINELINDKDYYEPKLNGNKKIFEINFDDIGKELNLYLNHLNNHYNLTVFSPELISYIFSEILNHKDIKKYSRLNFDTITLVLEKDNISYKRIYSIKYSPLKIIEEKSKYYNIKPKDITDISNVVLSKEVSSLDIKNSYNITNYITFDKFKEVFFKLPYLSDLFRVSLSYLSIDKNSSDKEFVSFKILVGYEDDIKGIFYFPEKGDNEEDDIYKTKVKYEMGTYVKITDTVDQILTKIIGKISNNKIKVNNEEQSIIAYLKSIYKIKCFICYDIDNYQSGRIMKENIGYFDTLYSCISLKNKTRAELLITFDNNLMSLNSQRKPVSKEDGYCKIYLSNNDDFIWRKCKVRRNNLDKVKLIGSDYKTAPRILNKDEDVVLAYDI